MYVVKPCSSLRFVAYSRCALPLPVTSQTQAHALAFTSFHFNSHKFRSLRVPFLTLRRPLLFTYAVFSRKTIFVFVFQRETVIFPLLGRLAGITTTTTTTFRGIIC